MSQPYLDEPLPPRSTPAVSAICVALLAALVLRYGLLGGMLFERWLGFMPAEFAVRPWTLLTYPLAGGRLLSLAVDVAALLVFGPRVEAEWGSRRFLLFALLCASGGALAHALVGAETAALVGPTAIALGVLLAHVRRWGHEEVWLLGVAPVSTRALAVTLGFATIVAGLGALDATPGLVDPRALSHLGGAAAAFLFLRAPQRDRIEQLRQRISPVPDVNTDEISRPIPRTPPRPRERPDEIDEIVARSRAAVSRRREPAPRIRRVAPPAVPPAAPAEELDRVLDKISAEGIESLTDEEREILQRSARRLSGS